MTKDRTSIPRSIRDKVENEYSHRCAVCGSDHPQMHHIDENPGNNDPLNLIPLCPNCHLTDQHNPTRSTSPDKLKLFRKHKDPTILKPQFHPLFERAKFLNELEEIPDDQLGKKVNELTQFISVLEMGAFYSSKIKEHTLAPAFIYRASRNDSPAERKHRLEHEQRKYNQAYRKRLSESQEIVWNLIIELIRYQKW